MTFRKIIIATDFSAGAERALATATGIARTYDAALVVAHVVEVPVPFGGEVPAPSELVEELKSDAMRSLDEAVREARARGVARVSSALVDGAPSGSLLKLVADENADLVVMGTLGRTGLPRFLLGSVAEKVVRHAACSVLVARSETEQFSHVLCPFDGDESSQCALARATEVARSYSAKLTLLNVVDLGGVYSERRAVQYLRSLDRAYRELLEKERTRLSLSAPRLVVDTRTAMGSPGGQILALLDDERSIDLVVVGSHGRTGIKHAVLGSVAEKVVRHARCSVLVARQRA